MLLDVVILAALIWQGWKVLKSGRAELTLGVQNVSYFQEGDVVTWDPIYLPPPPGFTLLVTGTLPAGLVSFGIRGVDAYRQDRHKLWDPAWFAIHETLAIPFWFFMGLWLDGGHSR